MVKSSIVDDDLVPDDTGRPCSGVVRNMLVVAVNRASTVVFIATVDSSIVVGDTPISVVASCT